MGWRDRFTRRRAAFVHPESGLRVRIGQKWFVRGQGMGRIVAIDPDDEKRMFRFELLLNDALTMWLPPHLMSDAGVRVPMTRSEARAAREALQEPSHAPDSRADEERLDGYFASHRRGDVAGLTASLRDLYARTELDAGEQWILRRLETSLLGEIADALGRPFEELRDEARGPLGRRDPTYPDS